MFRRLLREYLSLTHGERRGLQILGIIVILLVLFRALLPFLKEPELFDFSVTAVDLISIQNSLPAAMPNDTVVPHEPFPFDPNRVELDELMLMGVPPGVSRILINYRAAGGIFQTDSDLLKVYGISPGVFQRLQPYIRIGVTGENPATQQKSRLDWVDSLNPGDFIGLQPFELNRADSLQLLSVNGIGPIFARRIIRYRDLLGGFCNQEQLDEVYGFTYQQHKELSRSCYIDTSLLRKINLNDQGVAGLSRHPYINSYQAAALVAYRDQMGSYKNPSQIIENHLLPDSVFKRILPYLYAGQ